MALALVKIKREFEYNGAKLPDPGADMPPDQVRAIYAAAYPELTTAVVEGPEHVGDTMKYRFKKAVDSKG